MFGMTIASLVVQAIEKEEQKHFRKKNLGS